MGNFVFVFRELNVKRALSIKAIEYHPSVSVDNRSMAAVKLWPTISIPIVGKKRRNKTEPLYRTRIDYKISINILSSAASTAIC